MNAIAKTKLWIEDFVIGLNLCPFAAHPYQQGKIRFRLEETADIEKLITTLKEELLLLQKTPTSKVETSIVVIPNILKDFINPLAGKIAYNDFLSVVEKILEELGLVGELQVASFHPDYQYAGTNQNDPSNYVTRSPYPMFHLLREESLEKVIATYPDVEQIPFNNIKKLNELGIEEILKLIGR